MTRCRILRLCDATARPMGFPFQRTALLPGAREVWGAAYYLSFSAMLRCSLRCGSVFVAQLLSSGSSPLLA
jgi:hypothetical protein